MRVLSPPEPPAKKMAVAQVKDGDTLNGPFVIRSAWEGSGNECLVEFSTTYKERGVVRPRNETHNGFVVHNPGNRVSGNYGCGSLVGPTAGDAFGLPLSRATWDRRRLMYQITGLTVN